MNKLFSILIVSLTFNFTGNSQLVKLPYEEGQTITLEVIDYGKIVTNNKKFISLKKGGRTSAAEAHNEKVNSGKAKGSSKTVTYKVANVVKEEGLQKADLLTVVNGVTYTSEVAIFNDTIYFTRLNEPYIVKDADGNISAVSMLGVEKFPVNLNEDAQLPRYHDYGVSTPKYSTYSAERKEHVSTTYGLPYLDYLGRTCRTVTHRYKTITADVRKQESPYMHSIHNVETTITAIENFEFNGKGYSAFLIESISWSKFGSNIELESADAKIEKQQIKNNERVEKLLNRAMGTNEDGYLQTLVQKWYIPELGVVKQINYDNNGAVIAKTELLSIK